MEQKPPHSFAQKFIQLTILNRWWSFVLSGIGFISSYFTLTALSLHDFGLYQLVLSAMDFAGTFSVNFFDGVISNDISRAISEGKKNDGKRLFFEFAAFKIGVASAVTLIFFLIAGAIAKMYNPNIASYLRIIIWVMLINAVQTSASAFLAAVVSLRAIGVAALREITRLFIIMGLFFFSTLGIREVLMATVAASLVALIYVLFHFLKEFFVFFEGVEASRRFLFKEILKLYGFWVLVRSATSQAVDNIRPWLVRFFLNTEAVALYTLAVNLVTSIKKSFIPAISQSLLSWEVANPSRLRYIFLRGMKYSILYTLALGIGAFFFVPPLTKFLFPKYLPAMPLFEFLLITVPLHGVWQLQNSLLTALREQKLLAVRLFVEIGISLILLVLLLRPLGILAVGVSAAAPIIWRSWFLYKKIGEKYPYLCLSFRSIFHVDNEDRIIFMRGIMEIKSFIKMYSFGLFSGGEAEEVEE